MHGPEHPATGQVMPRQLSMWKDGRSFRHIIDPHTHAVWAGDRLADFDSRTSGKSYEDILKAGGGIRSSIRATAAAIQEDLIRLAAPRISSLLRSGATTIEVKSGYGFTASAEIAMLEAIQAVRATTSARLLSTLLYPYPSFGCCRASTVRCQHL